MPTSNGCNQVVNTTNVLFKIPRRSPEMTHLAKGWWEYIPKNRNMPRICFLDIDECDLGKSIVGTITINHTGNTHLEFTPQKGETPKKVLKYRVNSGSEFLIPGTKVFAHFADFGRATNKKLSRREKRKLARSN